MTTKLLLTCLSLLSLPHTASAFISPSSSSHQVVPSIISLHADKRSSGRGFAKSSPSPSIQTVDDAPPSSKGLESIETYPSLSSPMTPSNNNNSNNNSNNNNNDSTPEERSREILRNKFGLKSYEEQRALEGDARILAQQQSKEKRREKLRNIESIWPENADVFEILPPSVLKGIDSVLKLGLGTCLLLFLISGVFITIEAGSKATGNALSSELDGFIVNVVEPNFTPLLGVLLGFSIGLGLFSVGVGGSKGSVYKEDA